METGSWFVQSLNLQENLGFELGNCEIPVLGRTTEKMRFVTSTPLCINASTKHAEEAYKFLTFPAVRRELPCWQKATSFRVI